ncbi:MAG: hypothetical protein VX151_00110, partial [Candidatus Thermoplasmatota archaeon]|nr:hypothetical protein [Candidatus Thermoplasmatota archaeon]
MNRRLMEANRRNAEDRIALRMSQASNKDMASGETGSMVQDDRGWVEVGGEPTPPSSDESEDATPSNDHSDDDQSNAIQRLVEIAQQAHSDNDRSERKGLEDDVWNVLSQYRASLPGFHNPPSSFAGSRFEDELREMLQDGESEGFIPWASALVLATKLHLECITIRHPTFEHRYGDQRLKFATGLPWRAVFSTKAEVIHILYATDTDPTQVEDLVLNLREARDSLRPSATKMYDTITSLSLAEGVHAIIELEINGSLLSARFDREVKDERDHSNLFNGLARCMLCKTVPKTSRLKGKLQSLFPRLSSRTDLDDWNYYLVNFPWVARSDSEGNTVVHGDEHGGNFFIGRADGDEEPTVLPIDFFDAVFWTEGRIQSVGGTDGWRIFSSSLKDEPQVQPMEEQLNAVASYARLIVGLLQQRQDKMDDNIGGVLEQSLQSISIHLSSEKDLPKHNAMFLFSVLDWAEYWHQHQDHRLATKDFRAFEIAVYALLNEYATVVHRAFDIHFHPSSDDEIESRISSLQAHEWTKGESIALIRTEAGFDVANSLEQQTMIRPKLHVLHNDNKGMMDDQYGLWYVDA